MQSLRRSLMNASARCLSSRHLHLPTNSAPCLATISRDGPRWPRLPRSKLNRPPMSDKVPLTLACGDYEIVRSIVDGKMKPDGIRLTALTAMDAATRHWRFLRNREFEIAEGSSSSYLMPRDRG